MVHKFLEEEMIRTQKDKDRQQDVNAWQKSDSHANTVHANLARSEDPPKTATDCTKWYYRGKCAAGADCPNKHNISKFPNGKGAKGAKGAKGKNKGDKGKSKGKDAGKSKSTKGKREWATGNQQ